MSESESSNMDSGSTTLSSVSDNNKPIDRWTNSISYIQLMMSTSIGIMQFWWHPYLQYESAFIPFLLLYNVLSVLIGYPILYLEIALGVVTRKSVIKCWDIAPYARGVGWSMLAICAFTAFGLGIVSAYSLALLVHSFHSFLPWLHCAASVEPPCASRHRPLSGDSETPAQSFFHIFVLNLKRDGLDSGLGNIEPELTVYYVISWIFVYFIAVKKIYSYSKLIFFKDTLAFLVLICCVLGAIRLDGLFVYLNKYDWNVLIEDPHIWRRALEYVFLETAISQGSLVMLGSYCPKERHQLSNTAMLTFCMTKIVTMAVSFVLSTTHGALYTDYGGSSNVTAEPAAYTMIMWSEYVARVPGSQFWSSLIFFSLFTLSVSSTALQIQTIMSAFTGKNIHKLSWAFLILICCLFCFIGCFTICTQGGVKILEFLMYWPISMPRIPIAALLTALITYLYGQATFCENVLRAIGETPSIFVRISWAISPVILMGFFCAGMGSWPHKDKVAGWVLTVTILLPITGVMLCYLLFRCRVRNIMATEK